MPVTVNCCPPTAGPTAGVIEVTVGRSAAVPAAPADTGAAASAAKAVTPAAARAVALTRHQPRGVQTRAVEVMRRFRSQERSRHGRQPGGSPSLHTRTAYCPTGRRRLRGPIPRAGSPHPVGYDSSRRTGLTPPCPPGRRRGFRDSGTVSEGGPGRGRRVLDHARVLYRPSPGRREPARKVATRSAQQLHRRNDTPAEPEAHHPKPPLVQRERLHERLARLRRRAVKSGCRSPTATRSRDGGPGRIDPGGGMV
ncbi:hypothetical protein EES37_17580 [Streptomyces sp. ADI91-18]|nr:hypothetical protein EES37_17580 [Streptomyces sp. ADI91-18]